MHPSTIVIDITDQIPGLNGTVFMSAWIFAPPDDAKGIVFCLDAKATFHLVVPGYPEGAYSVASFLAQQGWLVIAVDSLGMGESTHQEQETLTMEMLTRANDVAFQQILVRLLSDDVDFRLPRLAYPSVTICLGHGRGAMQAIVQQARYRRYDALAVLSWSNYQCFPGGSEAALARAPGMENASPEKSETEAALRSFLYTGDVPSSVINADESHAREEIRSLTHVYDSGLMQQMAALIDVPLFHCLADQDVADNLQAEAATYPWSPEVTTFLLHGSAHRSHVANTRDVLWMRLEQWFLQMLDWNTRRKEGF